MRKEGGGDGKRKEGGRGEGKREEEDGMERGDMK